MKRYLFAVFFVFVFSIVSYGANSDSILLKYNQEIGTITNYKMTIIGETITSVKNTTKKTPMETIMYIRQKTKQKDSKGNLTIETKILSGYTSVDNNKTDLPNIGETIDIKMKPNGTIISQNNISNNSNSPFLMVLPEKPVKIGDFWNINIPANQQIPCDMETRYTVESFEKYEGEDCAKIKSKVSNNSRKDITVNAEGNIFFGYKSGRILGNQVISRLNMTQGQATISMTLKLKMNIVGNDDYKELLPKNEVVRTSEENYDFDNDPFFSGTDKNKKNSNSEDKEKKNISSLEKLLKDRKERIQKNTTENETIVKKEDETKEKERLKQLLKKFRRHEDKLEGVAFYRHPAFRQDGGREFYPYIGVRGSATWIRVFIQYIAEDWLFVSSINVYTDNGTYRKNIPSSEMKREVVSRRVVENADCNYDYDYENIFKSLATTKKTSTIRFIGSKYYKERGFSQKEREGFAETLELKELIDKYGIIN